MARVGLAFPGKAGGGTAREITGARNAIAPVTASAAEATARIHPTRAFTVTHSRSRQVATSPSSQRRRAAKLSWRPSSGGGGPYGSAIATPHHSPASRRVRLASRRREMSTDGTKNRPMPSPAATISRASSVRWRPGSPWSSMKTPAPSAIRNTDAATTSSSPSPASISPAKARPWIAAATHAAGVSLGLLRAGSRAVTIVGVPSLHGLVWSSLPGRSPARK
jgi:hypothetical protein